MKMINNDHNNNHINFVFVCVFCCILPSSAITTLFVTPSDDVQQILETAINQTNGPDIAILLDSGVFQSKGNCPISIRNLPAYWSISLIGKGSGATVVDCGMFNSRGLEIVNNHPYANITVMGLLFRNGVAPLSSPATPSIRQNIVNNDQSTAPVKKKFHRNLPAKISKKSRWVVFSYRVVYSLSPLGKIEKKVTYSSFPKAPVTPQAHNSNVRGKSVDVVDSQSAGGNIMIGGSSNVHLENLVVTQGTSYFSGGGIAVINSTNIIMNRCLVQGNHLIPVSPYPSFSFQFGGGGAWFSNTSFVTISNCAFSDNTINISDIIGASKGNFLGAAGIGIARSSNVMLWSVNSTRNSAVISTGTAGFSYLYGGGILLDTCVQTTLNGNIFVTDNFMQTVQGRMYGGGFSGISCTGLSLIGPIIVARNTLQSVQGSDINGGGMFLDSNINTAVSGYVLVDSNVMIFTGDGEITGGGVEISYCTNLSVSGPLIVSNNTMLNLDVASTSKMEGGGILLITSQMMSLIGPISIIGNKMTTRSNNDVYGGGLTVDACTFVWISGGVYIGENDLDSEKDGFMGGGGIFVGYGGNISFVGPLTVNKNTVRSRSNGQIVGGGIWIHSVANPSFVGPLSISNNIIQSPGIRPLSGGGLYVHDTDAMSLLGPISISNNTLVSSWQFSLSTEDYYTTTTEQLCSGATITASAGLLDDGSLSADYSHDLQCSWLILPPPTTQAYGILQLNVTMLDTELGFDFLYLYDGPTSLSPLIGKYSGTLPGWRCDSTTPCASIDAPIVCSSAVVLIRFTSDSSNQEQGFNVQWTSIPDPRNRTNGSTTKILTDFGNYPTITSGAGLHCEDSNIIIHNATIRSNTIQSTILSMGGGITVGSAISVVKVRLIDVTFIDNKAIAATSIGGALAVISPDTSCSCERCFFDKNMAVAKGGHSCYFATDTTLCPSAFGGSVFQGYNSVFKMSNSILQFSAAVCDSQYGIPCSALGGAIAVESMVPPLFSYVTCKESAATCLNTSVCTSTYGGCLHVADSSVNVVHSEFVSNTALLGVGSGGAISITGSSNINISSSQFESNLADHGGCVSLVDSSTATMDNSVFVKNAASSIGGVISIRGDSNMVLDKIYFEDNKASRASAIVSYNDNGVAKYTMSNSFGVVVVGNSLLMLGNSMFDRNNTWNCSQPGSVFTQDKTSSLFSLTCVACDEGTYAVDSASTLFVDRKCASCPFGGRCLGSNDASNGLYALVDHWGLNNNGSVKFYQCPSGYCCGFNQENCTYNYCAGNRIGLLCSQCADGYGMRFFAEGCKSDNDCNDRAWFAWIIILCAMAGALLLLAATGRPNKGMLSVLLYFYQVLPLIKSTSWKYTSSGVILTLQSVFNFSPSGSSDSAGICLVESMTTVQKIGSRMLIQGLVLVALAIMLLVHRILYKLFVKTGSRFHPHISHYVATAIRLCTIAYTTLVLVPLQMIQCVSIDNKSVWWWDASIECYTTSWQKAGFAAIAVLSPLPLCIMILLIKKWKSEDELKQKWQKAVWKVLSSGYKAERRWWLGVSLYRRLVMVVIYSTITDGNWRSMAASGACVLFVVMNFAFEPFKSRTTNRIEATSLLILTMISILTSPQLSVIQFGTSESIHDEVALEWLQFALAIVPVAAYVVVMVSRYILNQQQAGKDNDLEQEWDDHSICECCQRNEQFSSECSLHQYC